MYLRLDELTAFDAKVASREERVFWFVQLVRWLRGSGLEKKGLRLRYLAAQLEQHTDSRDTFSTSLALLVCEWDWEQLLAYGGIPRDYHFAGAVREWLAYHGLPAACDTADPVSVLALAFGKNRVDWLSAPELGDIALSLIAPDIRSELRRALEDALVDLGNQLVAQAHSPSVRALSRAERSPFAGLNTAVYEFLASESQGRRPDALLGRTKQCLFQLERFRIELAERGADLNTTFQLDRISQQLHRLRALVRVRCDTSALVVSRTSIAIIEDIQRSTSGRRLFARSTDLLRANLIDTAADVGRDYLTEEKSSWRAAFVAGAGGGALMAGATLVKYGLTNLALPTFYEGVAFSLNYAMIFCIAYLTHCTIATKLPAHTAATMAASVQRETGHGERLVEFVSIWRAMVRLQFAGLLGNVVVAGPLAFLIDVALVRWRGHHFLSDAAAEHVLHANSIVGPSIVYAALTGVLLWLSSLIGAAGDNWARITSLSDRIATNVYVMRRVGSTRARPFAQWFAARVGGLTGNASLGIMLGGVPAAFAIAHLPVDIRHVTVSTSSLALAWSASVGTSTQLTLAAIGVLAIGATNVAVSFALALQFALGSKQRKARSSSRMLVRLGVGAWLRGRSGRLKVGKHRLRARALDA